MTFLRNGELVDANGKVAGEGQTEGTSETDILREQLSEAQKQVEDLKAERNDLTSKLTDAMANALPEDAHDRLVKVNGIGDKLADQAIAALKAKPEAPKE